MSELLCTHGTLTRDLAVADDALDVVEGALEELRGLQGLLGVEQEAGGGFGVKDVVAPLSGTAAQSDKANGC